jgi:hypothetical protein
VEIFHRPYENRVITPNFFEETVPWHLADIPDGTECGNCLTGGELAAATTPREGPGRCPFAPSDTA